MKQLLLLKNYKSLTQFSNYQYYKTNNLKVEITNKKSVDLIHDPLFNKGLAFPFEERDRLDIRGLVPPTLRTIEMQEESVMNEFEQGWASRAAQEKDDEVIKSGVNPDDIRKWKVMQSLQDRNETLFYRVIRDNFLTMAKIIYTPTVGWACSHFSDLHSRSRGMYFSANDRGQMAAMIYNWPEEQVDAIVVTDGSRVLGLGDLGIGGLGISIGKLDLYVAAGGFHPRRVLPAVLDVGTNNQKLLNDKNYIGLKQNRLEGEEYYKMVDEFMVACYQRFPKAIIQFEDFQLKHAIKLLKRYRDEYGYLCFNDDIQGTAATALAGIYGALKNLGLQPKDICNQTFVVVGAGSAGSGAVIQLCDSMVVKYGMNFRDAANRFHILDKDGLITVGRKDLDSIKSTFSTIDEYANEDPSLEGISLFETVKQVKPTVLIGLSGVGGIFTQEVIEEMCKHTERPIIFALSNPTSRSECTAQQAIEYSNGQAIFAAGSPFKSIYYKEKKYVISQCNNSYIFPGLAFGAQICQARIVSDEMLRVAAEALAEQIEPIDIQKGCVFPKLSNIRKISCHVAARVIEEAIKGGLVDNALILEIYSQGMAKLEAHVASRQWVPEYQPIVYRSH